MGLADLPRAYFRGFTYWNPSTMNNNDYQPTYDPATATLAWPWLERHGVDAQQEFDRFATQPCVLPLGNDVVNVVSSAAPPALWNFYGDNSCGFVQPDEPVIEWPGKFGKPPGETKVIAYTNTAGNRIGGGDPWIGLPVALNAGKDAAKLVDVDPVCPWSSQIFVDSFRIGTGELGLAGPTAGRAHARWLFLQRIVSGSAPRAQTPYAALDAGGSVIDGAHVTVPRPRLDGHDPRVGAALRAARPPIRAGRARRPGPRSATCRHNPRHRAGVLRERSCAAVPQRDDRRVRELVAYRTECRPRHPAHLRLGLPDFLPHVPGNAVPERPAAVPGVARSHLRAHRSGPV